MRRSLDIQEHARLSLRFLSASTDASRHDLPYFWIDFLPNPPQFAHEMVFDDIEDLGRWLYGIACAQRVAGCRDAEATRLAMLREIDRRIAGPYGFPYSTEYTAERTGRPRYSWLWGDRSVLEGWIQCWRSETGEQERERLARRIETMISGLDKFAVRKGPCVFFPSYEPPLDWVPRGDLRIPDVEDNSAWQQFFADDRPSERGYLPLPADSLGGMIWPLVEWHELTGNPLALDLATGIAHTVVQYHPMRSNNMCPVGCFSNNHGVLNAMAGVLACCRHRKNIRHVIWAETLFEYYLNRCSSSFGWVTEFEQVRSGEGSVERLASEGCAVVDMVRVGIELGRMGLAHGWDVAERFTRNYMTQAQVRAATPYKAPADTEVNHGGRGAVMGVPAEHRDSRQVRERAVGALTGWGAPNDILDPRGRLGMCIQNCCSSHLPMGLMHVWEHIATREHDWLCVNMLLSQDGPWCRTVDYQPEEGVLEVFPKTECRLRIRMPDWVEDEKVRITVNGAVADFTRPRDSRCLETGRVSAGCSVRVDYPLRQVSLSERLGGTLYTTAWRGDTVVSITPQGRFLPVF